MFPMLDDDIAAITSAPDHCVWKGLKDDEPAEAASRRKRRLTWPAVGKDVSTVDDHYASVDELAYDPIDQVHLPANAFGREESLVKAMEPLILEPVGQSKKVVCGMF